MYFSIVVPLYNAQKELPDLILSVLWQSFRDFELILVNAGSRDDTWDCCRRFANADPRIKILNVDKTTAYDAKRSGVEEAQGTYVTVLFPDGRVKEDFLSGISSTLKKRETDLVAYPKAREHVTTKAAPFFYADDKDDYRELLLHENGINQHFVGFFAKKELYEEAFSYYHEGIQADEDDLLIFACFARAKGISFCSESLYSYDRKVYFPRPHGIERICSEEILFQRLNVVADDTDCSFARPNVTRHAFLVVEKELKNIAKTKDKEAFFTAFTRVVHSAFYFALKSAPAEAFDKRETRTLKRILRGRKRTAYFFMSREKEKKIR